MPVKLTEQPLDVSGLINAARRAHAGALAVFIGTIRDHAQNRAVTAIDYSAYESMAEAVLQTIEEECAKQWPDVYVLCHHRVGHLVVGDDAVVIVASSPHRSEAFEACRHVIERIKEDCPIWKKEWDEQGASWVSPRP